ncbi:hypothetical protein AGDE_13485 [Angomonas deanei]|uniref:Uncharacterized protein n=1 Tax=Angomonas deanei TaxID=59799 RepID=A0A7G2CLY1_9TRYP|nr:hypothetical protein AGDE_13485 [Angomonas deanei]CAD2219934.1 hypothetical protein, conserved [Angomonas deanei]|eukprot:EPY22297.1 hypothetical protein AGDE_13485 [Angomonas deanei]
MEELDQRIAQEEITKASVEAEMNALRLQVEEVKQRRGAIEAVVAEVTAMTVQDDNTDAIVKLVATLHDLGKQSPTDDDGNKADTLPLSPVDLGHFNVESFVQLFDGKDTVSKEQVKSALCSLHPLYAEASMEPYIDDLHEMLKEVFTAEREHAKFLSESDREIALLKKELNITAQ